MTTDRPGGLSPFFEARSVVVIGASADPAKIAGRPLQYLQRYGYDGDVYAVHPVHAEIFGAKAYATVEAIPQTPELALVMLPASGVLRAVGACAARGVRACVIFANGFADVGDQSLQEQLRRLAEDSNMRLLGPNCLGVVSTSNALTASFSSYLQGRMIARGNVALVTQSGSMGNALLLELEGLGVGISKWIATGNEADVDVLDCLEYLVDDPSSQVIAVFAEAFRQGWRWEAVARRARERGKPIVVLKAGLAERSTQAIASHSGKLVGSHQVWRDLAKFEHLAMVNSVEELCDAVQAFSVCRSASGGFAVLGTGGLGVLAMDECSRRGLPVAELQETTKESLRAGLPSGASVDNPIDPTPTSDSAWSSACATVAADRGVGYFAVSVTSLGRPYELTCKLLEPAFEAADRNAAAVCVTYLATPEQMTPDLRASLAARGVLVLPSVARAVGAFAHLHKFAVSAEQVAIRPKLEGTAEGPSDVEREPSFATEVLGVLSLQNRLRENQVSIVETVPVHSAEAAAQRVADWGSVVFKLEDALVAHKSEHGLVRRGISDHIAAAEAYCALSKQARAKDAVVVAQPQVGSGVEVLVACAVDAEFGPVVTVGAGGVLTELIGDARSSLAPVTHERAVELIGMTRVHRQLDRYRGSEKYDLNALAELICKVSEFFVTDGSLAELELNPVIVLPEGHGAVAVDVLAVRRPDQVGPQW